MPVTETLTRKVGPLPLWGYAVIIAGGVLAWKFLKGSSGSSTSSVQYPVSSDTSGNGGNGGQGDQGPPGPAGGFSQDYRDKLHQLLVAQQNQTALIHQRQALQQRITSLTHQLDGVGHHPLKRKHLENEREKARTQLKATNENITNGQKLIDDIIKWLGKNA